MGHIKSLEIDGVPFEVTPETNRVEQPVRVVRGAPTWTKQMFIHPHRSPWRTAGINRRDKKQFKRLGINDAFSALIRSIVFGPAIRQAFKQIDARTAKAIRRGEAYLTPWPDQDGKGWRFVARRFLNENQFDAEFNSEEYLK